ncbi:MAG: response regulator [Lentimicrobium sp.]|jgi:CheY-like chemotaxis protein|nr:response regulator [Lentimicrobium sp.]
MDKKELIFLVEDNAIFATTAQKSLEKDIGFEVKVFNTGEQLLKFTDENPDLIPSIIILDYYLNSMVSEAMDGGMILARLKDPMIRNNPFRRVPVIMLSSADEINIAVNLLKKGATDYILKDEIFFENLKKTIGNIINLRNYQTEIQFHKSKAEGYRKRLILMSAIIIALLGLVFYLFT